VRRSRFAWRWPAGADGMQCRRRDSRIVASPRGNVESLLCAERARIHAPGCRDLRRWCPDTRTGLPVPLVSPAAGRACARRLLLYLAPPAARCARLLHHRALLRVEDGLVRRHCGLVPSDGCMVPLSPQHLRGSRRGATWRSEVKEEPPGAAAPGGGGHERSQVAPCLDPAQDQEPGGPSPRSCTASINARPAPRPPPSSPAPPRSLPLPALPPSRQAASPAAAARSATRRC